MPDFDADTIRDESHLEELLASPSDAAVDAMRRVDGDILLLGVAGKMGPSLAAMVVNASEKAGQARRVIGVSRFSDSKVESQLRERGVETIRGDLLDEEFTKNLPDAQNVIFMTGMKFGTHDDASMTWGMNVYLPSMICRRFRSSRIMAFSTGNVYPFVSPQSGGSSETDKLNPVGEYGMSALGRERMFEFCSRRFSIPTSIVRLNYSVEMRYGVLVDLAQQVLAGDTIDLSMGHANVIWQADANSMAIASIADADSPPFVVNVAGPEIFSVRDVCERFAHHFDCDAKFTGEPTKTALLNNAENAFSRYGRPRVTLDKMIAWIADWLKRDNPTWQKPTHFQTRSGQF